MFIFTDYEGTNLTNFKTNLTNRVQGPPSHFLTFSLFTFSLSHFLIFSLPHFLNFLTSYFHFSHFHIFDFKMRFYEIGSEEVEEVENEKVRR